MAACRLRRLALLLVSAAPRALVAVPNGLAAELDRIAAETSAKFNCSVSIAYRDAGGRASAARGVVDFASGRAAAVEDKYPFGSVTKMLTGASIMRLAATGAISLDDRVAPLVDPLLAEMADADPSQGFRSLADLFGGENVSGTTVRQLLSMQSGVPDFDTATPCFPGMPGCVPKDPLRQSVYDLPSKAYSPSMLMGVPWVAHQWRGPCKKSFIPGMKPFCYSSTNFMLLGMILAASEKAGSWQRYDQSIVLPEYLKEAIDFATSGSPKTYTSVHGYDRTSYNVPKGEQNDHDNWEVSGVFSGWTASDIVATPATVADLTWEIYGPGYSVAPEPFIQQMIPGARDIYGLASFNLNSDSGQQGKYGQAYGHLGATYGYQSVTVYFPALQISLAVATNIERDFQEQPAYATCFAYNAAAGMLLNKTVRCVYKTGTYYSGGCKCDPLEEEDATVVV